MTVSPLRFALAIGALLSANALGAEPEKMITILHTNDIHGHIDAWHGWEGDLAGKTIGGMDRLATAINQVRAEGDANVVLLDAGDAIGDTIRRRNKGQSRPADHERAWLRRDDDRQS